MSRFSYIALCVALMLAVASAAASANSLVASAFAAAPGKVYDGTAATGADKLTWGTYTSGTFGPGATNTTVFAYGVIASSSSITSVTSRTINATMISNGTADSAMASVIGTDAVYATATTTQSTPQVAVGLGNLGLAYAALDASSCSQVYIAIFTGGSAAPSIKVVTTNVCSHCTAGTAASTGNGYTNTVHNVFYENATYYVAYSTSKFTETGTASSSVLCTLSTTYPVAVSAGDATHVVVNGQITTYLQGMTVAGALKWTAPAAIWTGAAGTGGAAVTGLDDASCGQGNTTNSTNLLCAYTTGTPVVVSYIPVTVATGAAGSATTIATQTVYVATAGTFNTYSIAGFVHSYYQQGILLNNKAETKDAGGTTTATANTIQFYNLTSGASATSGATPGGITLNITNAYTGGAYAGVGFPFSSGWGLVDSYSSASGVYASEWSTYFANGTINGTKTSFAAGASSAVTTFVDANGALWAGQYSTNADNSLSIGYLGKLVSQIYSSSTGNILATFFGLISLVIAALFVF